MSRPIAVAIALSAAAAGSEPRLFLVEQRDTPVLTVRHPDAAGNRYGFEGGRVVKIGRTYHLFTSEMADDPIWVKMRFGYWTSEDRVRWTRVGAILESSGEFEGKDPRAALWSPMPVFDDGGNRWNLFYVAYRAAPSTPTSFLLNHRGEIWRAVSDRSGAEGIDGPYRDLGVVLRPGPDSDRWEGLQGTDSFFPYRAGGRWHALYGSARTETKPIAYWQVGMASAPGIGGPWRRLSRLNPAPIEKVFIENPIVTPLADGGYMCVYDSHVPDAIGYAFSRDGVHWKPGQALVIQPRPGVWSRDVRTPLGLIPEKDNVYTVFYTGFEEKPDWERLLAGHGGNTTCAVGVATVRLQTK